MKGISKFIIGIYSLLTMVTAAVLLGVAAPLDVLDDFRTSFLTVFNSWPYAVLGGVVFLLALWVFLINLLREERQKSINSQGELGEYRITFTALENLVLQSAAEVKGVRDTKTRLSQSDGGLVIYLRLTTVPDTKVPELVDEIQKNIKEYVEEISGITVAEVKVLIDNITKEAKRKVGK